MTMKRLAAPRFWPIARKAKKFIVEPRPGPHPKKMAIPLAVIIRDILGYAQTSKEVKTILNQGLVKVDNKTKKDRSYPIGLMDIISIGKEHYRIIPSRKGFNITSIKDNEANTKLCRIRNKTCVGNKIQLNLHDGKNILVSKEESNNYKPGDVIILNTEKNVIKHHLKLEKDATAIIVSGNSIGNIGKIEKIITTKGSQTNYVMINIENRKIPIPKDYLFVVGKEKPVIPLGESK